MSKNLSKKLNKLVKETNAAGQAEFTALVNFFSDLYDSGETDVSVFTASCDEFITYAKHIKKALS
jgi:hypothetical protein